MRISGWLSPSGRFVECSLYAHLETISKDSEMSKIKKIASLLKELKETENECVEMAEIEGPIHAEWHQYEMHCDRVIPKIIQELYRNKYIRVGSSDDEIHFEAFPNVIKSRYQECKDFAEQHEMQAVFEPKR